ncbi:glycosyltransferase [Cycloclasticus pugetii]|jgi:glycosyltransferase involved in cell wall biosynthesis|uniref:glycosyltransferase n=1 Tax=Cycloclasticus pugetii TaxID=34068 RepID=UPI0009353859|nr:glycosyltransferase [Cycloclasticus pugetii]
MPKISIITVCFNAEKYIEQTIKSVLDQKNGDIEYIVIDGASTDKTLNIIRQYDSKITKLISEPDNGIADAMNKGLS